LYADYTTAADILPDWRRGILDGRRPVTFPVGDGGFATVRIGPGLLTLLGGPPGVGKTALAMQWLLDGLRATADLRAVVCNVETAPAVLLDRQLSRLSGIDYKLIRDRAADRLDAERLAFGFGELDAVAGRLAFLNAAYTLEHLASAAVEFAAGLVMVDYVQRVAPTGDAAVGDMRQTVSAAMQLLRGFADAGRAVVAVSAMARGKGKRGSTYDGAGLASFRESSELEFGCDDAYALAAAGDGAMVLQHLKARHGEPRSLSLLFDGAHQSFTAVDLDAGPAADPAGEILADASADDGGDE